MINIDLELGTVPSSLAALASDSVIHSAVAAIGQSYVADTKSYIESGRTFTERTGRLKASIRSYTTSNNDGVVRASVRYAWYVEHGHKLRGKSIPKGLKGKMTRAYPFLLTDQENRSGRGLLAASSVLQQVMNERNY